MGRPSSVEGKSTSQRLHEALAAMAVDETCEAPTASALCDRAGVSRNALYRYHPEVLHELHKLQRQRHRGPGPAKRALQQARADSEALRVQVNQLAALVDHYFAAWQESNVLLKRREQELSDLRTKGRTKLVSIRR